MVTDNLNLGFRLVPEFGGSGEGSGSKRNSRRAQNWRKERLRSEYRVLVDNLSSRASWRDLKELMKTAGEVTWVDAHKSHKNEGEVEFASKEDVESALKLDNTELKGRKIKIIDVSR